MFFSATSKLAVKTKPVVSTVTRRNEMQPRKVTRKSNASWSGANVPGSPDTQRWAAIVREFHRRHTTAHGVPVCHRDSVNATRIISATPVTGQFARDSRCFVPRDEISRDFQQPFLLLCYSAVLSRTHEQRIYKSQYVSFRKRVL